MMRRTGESEDEFVVNEADDMNDDGEKDSDSGITYNIFIHSIIYYILAILLRCTNNLYDLLNFELDVSIYCQTDKNICLPA
jgi:hypothetical protein